MFSSKPPKKHRSGPCPGRGCPVCREQRQARNKSRRAHSMPVGHGTRFAASDVLARTSLSAATAAPTASADYYRAQEARADTRQASASADALEALALAEEDGTLDLMSHTLFLEDDVLQALTMVLR